LHDSVIAIDNTKPIERLRIIYPNPLAVRLNRQHHNAKIEPLFPNRLKQQFAENLIAQRHFLAGLT
jgi:hypothetical protein